MPHLPVGFNNWMFSPEANSEVLESKNVIPTIATTNDLFIPLFFTTDITGAGNR